MQLWPLLACSFQKCFVARVEYADRVQFGVVLHRYLPDLAAGEILTIEIILLSKSASWRSPLGK